MVNELLRSAANALSNSPTPLLDARVLLAHCMGEKNAALIFKEPSESEKNLFLSCIKKRAAGIPVAYITGEKEFMGLRFFLNNDTLIPRPDTECLVERVLKEAPPAPKVLDLCTGSGCIGISLAHFMKDAFVTLSDISENALSAARKNAAENNVSERTDFKIFDVLSGDIKGGYNIITANPPYIKSDIVKTLEVSRFEPTLALDGGTDGLLFYKAIIKKAHTALKKDGMLALEIGFDQAAEIYALAKDFTDVNVYKDYGENDRVVTCIK